MTRDSMNPYSEFTCLYTSQKQKKAKTWQDGHLRFFFNNSKVILYDTKFNVLDSTFHRKGAISVGDDMDMDKHLITVESLTEAHVTNATDQRPSPINVISNNNNTGMSGPKFIANHSRVPASRSISGTEQGISQHPINDAMGFIKNSTPSDLKRRKWRPPVPATVTSNPVNVPLQDNEWDSLDQYDLQDIFSDSAKERQEPAANMSNMKTNNNIPTSSVPAAMASPNPAPKRRKVGLSRVTNASSAITGQSSLVTSHRPPSTQLEFPNAARCTNFIGKNQSHLLRRSMTLGSRFMSSNQYKDGMSFLIYEHLQIMVIEIAIAMWSIKLNSNTQDGVAMDTVYRSRGIHMHSDSTLRRRGDAYSGFPLYNEKSSGGGGSTGITTSVVQSTSQQGLSLSISNKEHHSKYSKDDLWVVSITSRFDATSTFFARSVFYGPSGNDIELICLSAKDSNVARDMLTHCTKVCAIRLLNAMSEFMMLDNMSENLTRTPLLPVLLNYVPPELVKASRTSVFKAPSRVPEKSGCIVLTEDDGIDVEKEISNTIDKYRLNQEQATVLRTFAYTVIRGPGWVQKSTESPPVILVHGVFGAGKSFLIAVLIVFIDSIIDKSHLYTKEKTSCRFLVASMTNVAVDRILMALLDLNYTKFVRVGSLKKVARRVLPYTAQSNTSRVGEDMKELQSILDDDSLSVKERQYVKVAMKKFQKLENRGIVEGANVVGATCIASTFEVLDDATFPIVILDEASQLLEPMSLIPICRAAAEKLVLIGDPLQLSPPLSTNDDSSSPCKGLSRTLFDRSSEMGLKPIMLRTQYRCHSRIAEISNTLFYSNVLQTGVNPEERAPLVENLPTLAFIENTGQEIQNTRTKSFTNPAEIKLVVTIIQRLLNLNIPETSIGVISLYKSQADGIQAELSDQLKNAGMTGSVQISTVDAFQGSEKDIIIVSTVRTDSIGFIDNHQRVNVALTRSKRHLFIIGNSQLLGSNKVWGTIIRDHCSAADSHKNADQFVQLLRTLRPLPKQVQPDPTPLAVSEDEDELDAEPRDEDQGSYHHQYEDTDYDEDDATQEQYTSEPALGAPTRHYALYETDEDDSDDNYDGREEKRNKYSADQRQQPQQPSQNYYRKMIYDQPTTSTLDNSSMEYNLSHDTDPGNQTSAVKGINTSVVHRNQAYMASTNWIDNSTRTGEDPNPTVQVVTSQNENSSTQSYQASLEGISQLEDALDGAFEAEVSCKASFSRNEDLTLIKKERKPELEDPEEVIWEMDDEPDEGDAVIAAINMKAREKDMLRDDTSYAEHTNEQRSIGNSSQHGQQMQDLIAYESQGIEDLDVADLSQLVASREHAVKVETNTATNVISKTPHSIIEGDEDDDDMSCLEVGDLDLI